MLLWSGAENCGVGRSGHFPREPPVPAAGPQFIMFSVLGRKSLRGDWVILPRSAVHEY